MPATVPRLRFLTLAASVVLIAAVAGCLGDDPAETATPEAAVQRPDTPTRSAPALARIHRCGAALGLE